MKNPSPIPAKFVIMEENDEGLPMESKVQSFEDFLKLGSFAQESTYLGVDLANKQEDRNSRN